MVDVLVEQQRSYDLLKKIVVEELTGRNFIESLKELFQIESVRRREAITTIADLLDFLERRDELSECNVESLQDIAEHCENNRLLQSLQAYVAPKETTAANPTNQYQLERTADMFHRGVNISTPSPAFTATNAVTKTSVAAAATSPNLSPYPQSFDETKRSHIYKLLSESIGNYWRRFGRELEIREGDMDELELRFPRDFSSRIYGLLRLFDDDRSHDPRKHVLIICRALNDIQRKDLRRKVEDIMCY